MVKRDSGAGGRNSRLDAGSSVVGAAKDAGEPDAGSDACSAGSCLKLCRSDDDCAARGQRCDTTIYLCVAPDAGTGTNPGTGGAGGAAGAGTAGDAGAQIDAAHSCPPPPAPTPGNLLILFDQSQSMMEMWQSTTKLEAAKAALVDAITPLKDSLRVGAIFLPYADAPTPCLADPTASVVQPIEGTGNIPFEPGAQFLSAFAAHWSMNGTGNGLGTPLNEAFDRADVALQAALKSGSLTGRIAVLVFTDGMPNCFPAPEVTGVPTQTEPARAAAWLKQGIATYVFGLPGADGVAYLDDIARNGGPHGTSIPSDPAELSKMLSGILQREVLQQTIVGSSDLACGGCASACPAAAVCIDGSCQCTELGQTLCGDACVITTSDDANCGGCGNACKDGKVCCASACVDTRSDKTNCGACGALCTTTSDACNAGTCTCGGAARCRAPQRCTTSAFADAGMCG